MDNYIFPNNYNIANFEAIGIYGWDDFLQFVSEISPSIEVDGQNYILSDSATSDAFEPTTPCPIVLETGDITFEEVDINKTIHRLRLRTNAKVAHRWLLEGSTNGGNTWKTLGIWTQDTTDERWINFRLTGAELRLRLTALDAFVPPYEFKDISYRALGRGLETV